MGGWGFGGSILIAIDVLFSLITGLAFYSYLRPFRVIGLQMAAPGDQ